MGEERQVKLFRNGRNQAVRIPRDFELPGEDAVMRKEGDRLIIEPPRRRTLAEVLDWLAEQEPLRPDEQMPMIEDSPPSPVGIFDDYEDDC